MKRNSRMLGRARRASLLGSLLAFVLGNFPSGVGAPGGSRKAAIPARQPISSAELQRDRNLGKAFYEQAQYSQAEAEFQKVMASGRALATDHLDLGLALIQDNKLDQALGELTTAQEMAPRLLAVYYNLGILYKRELRYPEAEGALEHVTQGDASDPAAWFNFAEVKFAEAEAASDPADKKKKLEVALDAELRVVKMGFARAQNFYVAALFHCFTIEVRLGQRAEAQKYLVQHEKVQDKVPGISVRNPALEGGKYGAILVPIHPPLITTESPAPAKLIFTDITSRLAMSLPRGARATVAENATAVAAAKYSLEYARRNFVPLFGPSVGVGDYDGDGHPDLYVVNPAATNRLYHNNGDGTFTDVTAKAGVAGPGGAVSATFADYDNSGHLSLFVAGLGGVHLYKNDGKGAFTDVTAKAGLALPESERGELDTRAILFDADNDGFLDLILTAYTDFNRPPKKGTLEFPADFAGLTPAVHFYRNNGDGTFTDVTEQSGLARAQGRMRGAVFADFNNDGYTDLVLLRDDGPPMLFLNQGADHFADATKTAGAAFSQLAAYGGQAADFDHDGNFDLALWTSSGYTVLRNDGRGRFMPFKNLPVIHPPKGLLAFRGIVADLESDGFPGLLLSDEAGRLHFVANQSGRFQEARLTLSGGQANALASLKSTWLSSPGLLDLVGMTKGGTLVAWQKSGPPAHWLEVKLAGSKSNTAGIGDIIELKAGNFYDKLVVRQSPVRVYTGKLSKLDVVRVTWPNAIVQNSMNVETDKTIELRESERLASSCPFLYVWNGRQFVFYTDVLGASPLGELQPDGARATPNPEEWVRLGSRPRPQNGFYTFQLTSEMREVDYLDRARLLAVDHPADESVYSNEIYSSPPTPLRAYLVRKKRFPLSAVDDQGRNVLPLLLAADGRYAGNFRQSRILGLARLHMLTLDLGPFPNASQVALYLNGWVFWTDSNAARALMSNSKLKMISPYLQVRDARGRWVTVVPDMGLPSGTRRTMRVDLTGKFLSSDHHLRIVTNLSVSWDQIFFTTDEAPAPAPSVVPLVSADLHYRGFSTPVSDPQHRHPDDFIYTKLLQQAPWDPMRGDYTRYGPVTSLLSKADDHLVVMETGDEITLRFDARSLPPIKPGWERDFFLDLVGYAKDGEPNTADSKTVMPLPFRAMANYPPDIQDHSPAGPQYQRYLRRYETRPGYRLIPPLAPAPTE